MHWADAKLSITNSTSQPASYSAKVEFRDAQGRTVDTGTTAESDVAPGETVDTTAPGTKGVPDKVDCAIVRVQRVSTG
jgi:hypothetical protein